MRSSSSHSASTAAPCALERATHVSRVVADAAGACPGDADVQELRTRGGARRRGRLVEIGEHRLRLTDRRHEPSGRRCSGRAAPRTGRPSARRPRPSGTAPTARARRPLPRRELRDRSAGRRDAQRSPPGRLRRRAIRGGSIIGGSRRVVGDHRQRRREHLEHAEPEPLEVRREEAERAVVEQRRELVGGIRGHDLDMLPQAPREATENVALRRGTCRASRGGGSGFPARRRRPARRSWACRPLPSASRRCRRRRRGRRAADPETEPRTPRGGSTPGRTGRPRSSRPGLRGA